MNYLIYFQIIITTKFVNKKIKIKLIINKIIIQLDNFNKIINIIEINKKVKIFIKMITLF